MNSNNITINSIFISPFQYLLIDIAILHIMVYQYFLWFVCRLIMTTQSNQTDIGSTNPFLQLTSRDTINSSTNIRHLNLTPSELQCSSGTVSNTDQIAIQHLKKLFLDYQRSGGTKASMDIKLYRILPLFCNVYFSILFGLFEPSSLFNL